MLQEYKNRIENISNSKVITKLGNKIYFHSPYHDEYKIYEWKIGSEEVKKVASYSSQLRGLAKGKVFSSRRIRLYDYLYSLILF